MNIVSHSSDGNGILFEGTKGRFHVARNRIKGKPFEDLQDKPLPENAIAEVYETDISKIRLGQQATISSTGFIGKLSGTVAEIGLQIGKKDVLGNDPAADVDSRVVEVKIRLEPASSEKVKGLTNLQVNVVINLGKL